MNLGLNNNNNNMLGMGMGMGTGAPYSPNYAPRYEIIKVNGEAGARNFQMAPNSNQLLLDSSTPNLMWLVQTDGAGYLTATPWDITPHQAQPQVNVSDLEARIKHLEDMYAQLNTGTTKQSRKHRNESTTDSTD